MGSGHTHPAPMRHTWLGRLDARAKVLAILPVILAVNILGTERLAVAGVAAAAFAALFATAGHGALASLRRVLYLPPFVLFIVVTLPFSAAGSEVFALNLGFARLVATDEGLRLAASVAARAGTSLLGILALSGSTEAPELFRALRGLGCPKAFVAVMAMIYRYLFEMGDELARVRRAAAARGFEARDWRALPQLGAMAGALLVRSVVRSEEINRAMVARGYDGEVRTLSRTRFGAREAAFVAAFLGAVGLGILLVLTHA